MSSPLVSADAGPTGNGSCLEQAGIATIGPGEHEFFEQARQAALPKAQASPVLPVPVAPQTRRLRASAIHWQEANRAIMSEDIHASLELKTIVMIFANKYPAYIGMILINHKCYEA
ncbi:MAG: hypothetical protein WCJ64_04940 [Rhodospirillaceae bacterium]